MGDSNISSAIAWSIEFGKLFADLVLFAEALVGGVVDKISEIWCFHFEHVDEVLVDQQTVQQSLF